LNRHRCAAYRTLSIDWPLKCALFAPFLTKKSTQNRTREEIMGVVEHIGGNVMSASSRENIIYSATLFRHHLPEAMSLLAETVRCPKITVRFVQQKVDGRMRKSRKRPRQCTLSFRKRTPSTNSS
jgi:processing peptidase subunit alpha